MKRAAGGKRSTTKSGGAESKKGRGSVPGPRRGRQKGKIDSYTVAARQQGYPARSVFKLQEIDQRYHLVPKGGRVLDLGSAPGSWLKYLATTVGERGRAVGVDISQFSLGGIPNVEVLLLDVLQMKGADVDPAGLGFDAVVSDMAPSTTGIRDVDQARSLELSSRALHLAVELLRPGGNFLCKVFQGPMVDGLRAEAEGHFREVRLVKPAAVRKDSFEIYLMGKKFVRVGSTG